jgi:SAM-dependent methyltransferase
VLEAGCGTGQLATFLGLGKGRQVFGGDICWNSLCLAERFRERERIAGAAFVQMNLFRPLSETRASMSSSPTACCITPPTPAPGSRHCCGL